LAGFEVITYGRFSADQRGTNAPNQESQPPAKVPDGTAAGGSLALDSSVQRLATASSDRIPVTPDTLAKRLNESGYLKVIDIRRQRRYLRKRIAGSVREVWCLSADIL